MNENERIVCEFLRKIAPSREWRYLGEVEHYWIGELCDELNKQLKAENAKLRELCADMYGFIKRMDEDCGDVTFSDCFDYCKHDTADDGCCKTGECWYEQRLRELGVEVDE